MLVSDATVANLAEMLKHDGLSLHLCSRSFTRSTCPPCSSMSEKHSVGSLLNKSSAAAGGGPAMLTEVPDASRRGVAADGSRGVPRQPGGLPLGLWGHPASGRV